MLSLGPAVARCSALLAFALICLPSLGLAQPPSPPPQHTEDYVAPPAEVTDETRLTVSAGGTLNTGNTRSVAGNVGARFSLKRSEHQLSASVQGVIGSAAGRQDDGSFGSWQENTRNIVGRLRYDLFLSTNNALFAAMAPQHNRFAGLDLRLQNQVGYLRNLLNENDGAHRLWLEGGYDLTYDDFFPDPLLDSMGNVLPGDELVHSIRLFTGYDNHVAENLTFRTGVEVLLDLEDVANVRLQSETELLIKVAGDFQVGINFAVRFDNVPVEGADKLDTISTLNLLYNLDLQPAAPEPS